MEVFIVIDENGKLSVGDLALTLISVFCGVGLILRGAKIGLKLLKYSNKIIKFAKKSKILTKAFKYLNKGKNFLISKFHYFSKTYFNKISTNIKKLWNVLEKGVSLTSKVFGWLSNPPKKIVSTIFNQLISKYKDTGKVFTIFHKQVHVKTLVNSFDKFLNNPARTIKGAFFPNFNKIKENIHTAYNWINTSYNQGKKRASTLFNKGKKYLKNKISNSKILKNKRIVKHVKPIWNNVKKGYRRFRSNSRKIEKRIVKHLPPRAKRAYHTVKRNLNNNFLRPAKRFIRRLKFW